VILDTLWLAFVFGVAAFVAAAIASVLSIGMLWLMVKAFKFVFPTSSDFLPL